MPAYQGNKFTYFQLIIVIHSVNVALSQREKDWARINELARGTNEEMIHIKDAIGVPRKLPI